jgi:hypothetical protein
MKEQEIRKTLNSILKNRFDNTIPLKILNEKDILTHPLGLIWVWTV